ncbi:MAG: DsbA family oxidoreductase [Chloroflexota bacterium]|nr:MAG: DsbA family oxidoreductase [Chloroflexota bacterium]
MEIEVFQDTVCPWCRIGKRHLQLALEQWDGERPTVRYRSFFLNPGIPPEGYEFRPYMQAKLGDRIPLDQLFARPTQAGAQVGLTFNFDRVARMPNTELSHRLIKLAPEEQRAALLDDVYAAYFEHGQDIGALEVLLELGARRGMDRAQLEAQLRSDAARDEVLADISEARELGISGVPFFVLDGRYGISGAQPPAVLLEALQMASRPEAA